MKLTLSSAMMTPRWGNRYSVECESLDADKSRYHVWVETQVDGSVKMDDDGVVYKNAPKGPESIRTKTIKLHIGRGQGKIVGEYLMQYASDLLPLAIKARQDKIALEQIEHIEAVKAKRIDMLASKMYAGMVNLIRGSQDPQDIIDLARLVIAEVEQEVSLPPSLGG